MATPNAGGSNERLDRIEDKIDKLSQAIVALARVEEKIADLEQRRFEQHERLNKISSNMDNLTVRIVGMCEKQNNNTKISWFLFTILITGLVVQYFN